MAPVGRIVIGLLLAASLAAQEQADVERGTMKAGARDWQYLIRRLPPSAFPQLPSALRRDLENRGCQIPQTYAVKAPENVISGRFLEAGEVGWAVLCSVQGTSSLLVFGSGSAEPITLATAKDVEKMQVYDASGVMGYSWAISTASPKRIRGVPENRQSGPIAHDGIEDAVLEKGSQIHYFRGGKWVTLAGSD